MVKRLIKTGNSLAVVLDRPLLEAAGIDIDTPVEVSTNGDVIVITPVRSRQRQTQFRKAAESIQEQYSGVFRRLADS